MGIFVAAPTVNSKQASVISFERLQHLTVCVCVCVCVCESAGAFTESEDNSKGCSLPFTLPERPGLLLFAAA